MGLCVEWDCYRSVRYEDVWLVAVMSKKLVESM
jgi:hypothetical protein